MPKPTSPEPTNSLTKQLPWHMVRRRTKCLLTITTYPRTPLDKTLLWFFVFPAVSIDLKMAATRNRWSLLQPRWFSCWLNQCRWCVLLHFVSECSAASWMWHITVLNINVKVEVALMTFVWSSHIIGISLQKWRQRHMLAASVRRLLSPFAVVKLLHVFVRDFGNYTHYIFWSCKCTSW